MRIRDLRKTLKPLTAQERVQWIFSEFENVVMTSSFGIQSAVCLHLVTQIKPDIPVILLDTQYLFPETYQYVEQLTHLLNLNVNVYRSSMLRSVQEMTYGELWKQGISGLNYYNYLNKMLPFRLALRKLNADVCLTGIRHSQSESRKKMDIASRSGSIIKVNPIIDWSDQEVDNYLTTHQLPQHPLREKGYVSVGDVHTSVPLTGDMIPEETRFFGLKRECGLHE